MLSIVVPIYNESLNLDGFFARLIPALEGAGEPFEVICIDDGSKDDSVAKLRLVNQADPRVKLLVFSRNFGKEAALSAGLANATGEAVIPIDADLQHPPEMIAQMVAKWREGYDVVYAVRRERTGQGLVSRLQAHAFYWLFEKLSEVQMPREVGDFRLLDRKVVDAINAMPERTRFMNHAGQRGHVVHGARAIVHVRNHGNGRVLVDSTCEFGCVIHETQFISAIQLFDQALSNVEVGREIRAFGDDDTTLGIAFIG